MDLIIPPLIVLIIFAIIFALGVGLIYLVLLVYDGQIRQCPQCHRRRAAVVVKTDEVHSRTFIDQGMVARMARGNQKWVKPQRITETIYDDHLTCQYCDHTWIRTVTERKTNPS